MSERLIFKCPCGDSYYDAEYDIEYEDWLKKYKPIKNPVTTGNGYDGFLIDYSDKEEYKWLSKYKGNQIWTVFDDGSISSGVWRINRFGYIVTEIPYCKNSDDDGESYEMVNVLSLADAEHECEHYHTDEESEVE